MATHATSKSVICAETEVQMHRIIYHWDIKNFDRICTPENEEFEPISSNPFKAGAEIGRESEWELILSAESGKLTFNYRHSFMLICIFFNNSCIQKAHKIKHCTCTCFFFQVTYKFGCISRKYLRN